MRFDQLPRSDNVEDRRGDRSGFPMGRAGGIGLGTIILLAVVGWAEPRSCPGWAAVRSNNRNPAPRIPGRTHHPIR
jgi:predicted metalloprotease